MSANSAASRPSPLNTSSSSPIGSTATLPELPPNTVFLGQAGRTAAFKSEQLLFIGKENLQHLKQTWEGILAEAQPILKQQTEIITLLEGKTAADLLTVAQQYDNPQYASQPSRYTHENTEPADPEALERAAGSTTLNICGWCKFALVSGFPYIKYKLADGSERAYDPSCGVFSDEWTVKHRCDYNTPCYLTHPRPDQPDLAEIHAAVCERHEQYVSCCQKVQQQIDYLDALITLAESKPLFPTYRTVDYYPIGTPVYFLYDDLNAPKLPYPFSHLHQFRGNLHRGTLTEYVRYQFVKSSIRITDAYSGSATKPVVFTFDYDSERVLSAEELMYLLYHPDYAQIWINSVDHNNGLLKRALTFHQQYRFLPSHTVV